MVDGHYVCTVAVAGPEIGAVTNESKLTPVLRLVKVLHDLVQGAVPLHEIIHRASHLLDIAELVDACLGDSVLVDAVQIEVATGIDKPGDERGVLQFHVRLHFVDVLLPLSAALHGLLNCVTMNVALDNQLLLGLHASTNPLEAKWGSKWASISGTERSKKYSTVALEGFITLVVIQNSRTATSPRVE